MSALLSQPLNPDLAKAIVKELERRKTTLNLTDYNFPKQAIFLNDPSPLVAGFCTRRAGKSYGVGLKLYNACLQNPGVTCIYIALTRDSAKRIMFHDVFRAIDRKFSINAKPNMTELSLTFPNGSMIYCIGMDSSASEMEKALGQKYKVAVVDEAGSFRQDLHKIVYSILKPACADLNGQIILTGTPTNLTKGLFYDVVWSGTQPGWKVHKWSAFDNPYMAKQWHKEIEELKADNPRIVETPWFKQNYLGDYTVDQTALCYKYNPEINLIAQSDIPELDNYVLGIDLGYTDATAFSLLGFRNDSKKLYVVHTNKETKLTISQVAERIEFYIKRYKPYKFIIDNAAKQSVEELKQRFGFPLTAADKAGKADFIEIMNSDFILGNIQISDACSDLSEEYLSLIWDDRATKKQEHPNCENHCADATLYAWRYCYQYVSRPPKPKLSVEEKLEAGEEAQLSNQSKEGDPWWET